jgi:D-alanine-D-alanine ligase
MPPQVENTAQPIAVISGGLDYELDDIAKTEADVLTALESLGYRPTRVCLRDAGFADALLEIDAAMCFIVDPFYFDASQDGTRGVADVRVLLETLGLAYTGSPCSAAVLCRDKIQSKERFRTLGIDTPRGLQLPQNPEGGCFQHAFLTLGEPLILKPRYEGSGVGVSLCARSEDLRERTGSLSARFPDLMVEEYVEGIEVTVGVVGTGDTARALPPVELELLESRIYDYETKRNPDSVNRHVPARVPDDVRRCLETEAKRIHVCFGCSGLSRIDFRVAGARVVAIEINASPSLSRDEHIPRSVRALGWRYEDLIALVVADAMRKSS